MVWWFSPLFGFSVFDFSVFDFSIQDVGEITQGRFKLLLSFSPLWTGSYWFYRFSTLKCRGDSQERSSWFFYSRSPLSEPELLFWVFLTHFIQMSGRLHRVAFCWIFVLPSMILRHPKWGLFWGFTINTGLGCERVSPPLYCIYIV